MVGLIECNELKPPLKTHTFGTLHLTRNLENWERKNNTELLLCRYILILRLKTNVSLRVQ